MRHPCYRCAPRWVGSIRLPSVFSFSSPAGQGEFPGFAGEPPPEGVRGSVVPSGSFGFLEKKMLNLILLAQRIKHPKSSPWYERIGVECVAFAIFGVMLAGAAWVWQKMTATPTKDEDKK